jgi:hypothetical protein
MNMIQEILKKFAPQLAKHGVKLSVEETAPEATQVVMAAEGALADGTMIYSSADAFAEGVDVFVMDRDGNPTPLADGEYTMDNGMVIVVAAGVIESMAEAITEEPIAPADAVAQEVAESYSKEQVEGLLKNVISEFEAKLSAAEKQITELSKAPAATTVKQSRQAAPEAPLNIKAMANIEDRTRAIVARYKNK